MVFPGVEVERGDPAGHGGVVLQAAVGSSDSCSIVLYKHDVLYHKASDELYYTRMIPAWICALDLRYFDVPPPWIGARGN